MFVPMDGEITSKRDPRGQGDQGERSAILWLLEQDCPVFLPIGHSPDIDLITVIDNRVMRVQVKTSTQFHWKSLGGCRVHAWRQSQLEWPGQVPGPIALRPLICPGRGWATVVHPGC
jgi:hypothetical protein